MSKSSIVVVALAATSLLRTSTAVASPGTLYWTFNSPNGVQPVMMDSNLDGTNPKSLLQGGNGGARPLALDPQNGFLYQGYGGTITRYNLDGSNPTSIFNTSTNPTGISGLVVDDATQQLYWTFSSPNGNQSVLMESNLDGSNPKSLLQSGNGAERPLALDQQDGFLYLGSAGNITRYNLDGSNPTSIFNTSTNPTGISGLVVDDATQQLYWTFSSPNGNQSVLMESNLDGSNPKSLLQSGNGAERPLALDQQDGFLYLGSAGNITRYNLDGSNPTQIFNTSTNPTGISGLAVLSVPEPAALFPTAAVSLIALLRRRKQERSKKGDIHLFA